MRVQTDLAKNYRIPFPAAEALGERGPLREDRHLRGTWHELTQHLRDLRYLDEPTFLAYHQHKRRVLDEPVYLLPILAAVLVYLPEDTRWTEASRIYEPTAPPPDLNWLTRHLPTITERLASLTSWDGRFPEPRDYVVGEKTVFSRSLAYRLRTLNSSTFPLPDTGTYFSREGLPNLELLLREGLDEPIVDLEDRRNLPVVAWERLSRIDALLRGYLNRAQTRDERALLYQIPPVNASDETLIALEALPDDALRLPRLPPELYHLPRARQMLRRARRRTDRRDDGLDVRLLQIKLWQIGYYVGAVDGQWGPVSHDAFKTFLTDEAAEILDGQPPTSATGRKRRQAAKVRTLLLPANAKQGVYVADLRETITLFGAVDTPVTADPAATALRNAQRVEELRAQAGISQRKLDAKVLAEDEVRGLYPDAAAKPERRVSYAATSFFGKVWGGLRKILRWMKRKIGQVVTAVGRVLGPVFNFVKALVRPIRLAVTRFFNGFKFLANWALGRPITTAVPAWERGAPPVTFATRFALDLDATTYAGGGFEPGRAEDHSTHLATLSADLFYFVDAAVLVIRSVGRLSGVGGWVGLGLRIAGVRPFRQSPLGGTP